MRVRISYSVDLLEVPNEASRMLEEVASDLQHITDTIDELSRDISKGLDEATTLETLDKCRIILAKVDSRLSDNSMILSGYYDALNKVEEASQEGVVDVDEG